MKKKKKSGIVTKLVVLGFAVYAAVTLVSLQSSIDAERASIEYYENQIEIQNQKNMQYSDSLTGEPDSEYIADLAREKLGLIAPGERVFYDVSK